MIYIFIWGSIGLESVVVVVMSRYSPLAKLQHNVLHNSMLFVNAASSPTSASPRLLCAKG